MKDTIWNIVSTAMFVCAGLFGATVAHDWYKSGNILLSVIIFVVSGGCITMAILRSAKKED